MVILTLLVLHIGCNEKPEGTVTEQPLDTSTPVEGDSTFFHFSSYHELADTPMIIGKHSEYIYDVGGVPHVVAIEGETDLNHEEFVEATRKLAGAASRFFGDLPYEKYCFILFMSEQVLGGLEHANGTTMGRPPWGFSKNPRRMTSLVGLTAHEYFHTWNVKRIPTRAP